MVQALLPGGAETALVATAGWLLTYLLHSLGWLGLARVLDGRSRVRRSPRLRSAVWTAAVAGGLLTASVQTATGLGPGPVVDVAESEKLVAELPSPVGTAPDARGSRAGGARVVEPTAERGSAGGEDATVASAAEPAWRSPHRPADFRSWLHGVQHGWPFLLALTGLAGGLVGLLVRGLQWVRLRRRLAGRTRIRGGPVRAELDDLARSVGFDAPVVLSRSPSIGVPLALPGGEICLPDGLLDRLDAEARRAVLAHELAHLQRRDPALLLVLSTIEAVLFFQPLNRIARKRIVAASERISDDRVRDQGLGPALADGLVAAAERLRDGPRAAAAGLASSPDVGRRVARLLETPAERAPDRGSPTLAAAAGVLLGLGTVVGPSVGVELSDHPPHVGDAPAGEPAPVVSTSAGPGTADGTARVRLDDARRPLRVTLRPARRTLRLTLPGGRAVEAPTPDAGGAGSPQIRLTDAPPGDYVLHVPPSVDRLAVEVDGRLLAGAPGPAGGELPALIAPPDGG